MLALVMGIGMVALAFTAVYRGAAGNRQDQVPPPATTGVDATPTSGSATDRVSGPSRPRYSAPPSRRSAHPLTGRAPRPFAIARPDGLISERSSARRA